MKPLAILAVIDVETELFNQGTSGGYVLLRTDPIPRGADKLRILLHIRIAEMPVKRTRFTLKPESVNEEGLVLVRLPDGLPFSLAELRFCRDHVCGPKHLVKLIPNRKDTVWKSPSLQF